METSVECLLKKTVPDELCNEIEIIYDSSKEEVERLMQSTWRYKRSRESETAKSSSQVEVKEKSEEVEKEKAAKIDALAIGKTMMKLWSAKMFRHAENIVLRKAAEENHFQECLMKFVYIFEQDEEEEYEDDWVIIDEDDTIIALVWERLNLEKIFNEFSNHRRLIQKSYDRIKNFIPELYPEIIQRHDLSKYAFSQAIGYALKFVHNLDHPIWKAACELHLQCEPHHPKTWGKKFTPLQKKENLQKWLLDGSLYGFDVESHAYESECLPIPFLYESYIDMMAVEWEKKKGQRPDISLSELIYMDDKFLLRYSEAQRKLVTDLIDRVIASDDTLLNVKLTNNEIILLSTVNEEKRNPLIFKLDFLKKKEIARQEKLLKASEEVGSVSSFEDLIEKASYLAFCNVLAFVVMDMWDSAYRKSVENLVLKRAIKEEFIEEKHIKWIFFAEKAKKKVDEPSSCAVLDSTSAEDIVELIWAKYNMREHFSQMKSHRYWIAQSYFRLAKHLPELPIELIERHDLSKFAFSQAVGYTLKWVHDINALAWKNACDLHLNAEPHHPQMWARRHTPEDKQSCLEAFLCFSIGGSKYGIDISQLNLASENMALIFLLESFIDMVGVEWERKKNKRLDISTQDLIYMDDKYLQRYTEHDKNYLMQFIQKIHREGWPRTEE
ncbi:hypothetical protein SK128_022265, partial [Halocaridina rubra]